MGATILVADDKAFIVSPVALVLEENGHRIVRASAGVRALILPHAGGIDLLIADNMMPRLGGLELIAHVGDHQALAVPAILMCVTRPVWMPPHVAFLPKPFDIRRLAAIVADQLAA
jgi:CheY-like chemotaxis protein